MKSMKSMKSMELSSPISPVSRDSSSFSAPASHAMPPHPSSVAFPHSRAASGGIYILGLIIPIPGRSHASVPLYQPYCQASGFGGTVQTGSWKEPDDSTPSASLMNPPASPSGPVSSSASSLLSDPSSFAAGTPAPVLAADGGAASPSNLPDSPSRPSSFAAGADALAPSPSPFERRGQQITVHFNADQSVDGRSKSAPQCTFKPQIPKIKVYPGDTASTFHIAHNQSDQPITGIPTYHVTPQKVGIHSNKIQCSRFEEQRSKPNETTEPPTPPFIDPDSSKDPKMLDVDTTTPSHTSWVS
jgi:cytochrome c oxidase assembly protein Cox11